MNLPDKINWPPQTNSEIRDGILADTLNALIDYLGGTTNSLAAAPSPTDCSHPTDRVYKMGHVLKCKDCKKVWKP